MKRTEIVKEYKTKTREDDNSIRDAWKRVEKTSDGKIIIDDMLRFYFRKSHVKGDPVQTAFNEGWRGCIGNIINKIYEINDYKEEQE